MFNTIFNSFFRTIGRIMGYLLVGGLIALIMAKISQNKSIVKDISISEVKIWEN